MATQSNTNDELLAEIINGNGVGSHLWRLFSRLGIHHKPDCPCLLLADIMNGLGPQGCRERREDLLRLMRKNQKKYGWHDYLKTGARVMGLAITNRSDPIAVEVVKVFRKHPTNPLPGLLDLAINLSEKTLAETVQQAL